MFPSFRKFLDRNPSFRPVFRAFPSSQTVQYARAGGSTQPCFFREWCCSFPDDSSDIEEEADQQYEVNYWRKEEEVPTGFTFKSKKKIFVKAVDNIKIKLKKGVEFVIDDLKIKILDRRNGQNGAEIDKEIVDK